jgi:MFS family permease
MGGAIAAPTALSLIATTFAEGPERNRAFGVYAAMAASGGALGLLLGGILTDVASWHWTLFINAPIGLAVLLIAPRVLGESKGSGAKLDVPGAITATLGMASLVYGFTNAATHSWGNPGTLVALGAALVLLTSFVLIELRTKAPLMPMRILRNRNRTGGYLVMLCLASGMFAVFFFTTQFLQTVHGWSPLETGVGFLPMPATIMIMSMTVARRLVARIGVRPLLLVGPVFVSVAMLYLAQLGAGASYAQLLGGLILMAIGMGCCFVPLTLTAVADVPAQDTGLASALLNTGQQLGGAVGLSVLGTVAVNSAKGWAPSLFRRHTAELIANHGKPTAHLQHLVFVHGQSAAFYGAAVAVAIGFVCSASLIRVRRPSPPVIEATAEAAGAEPHALVEPAG